MSVLVHGIGDCDYNEVVRRDWMPRIGIDGSDFPGSVSRGS